MRKVYEAKEPWLDRNRSNYKIVYFNLKRIKLIGIFLNFEIGKIKGVTKTWLYNKIVFIIGDGRVWVDVEEDTRKNEVVFTFDLHEDKWEWYTIEVRCKPSNSNTKVSGNSRANIKYDVVSVRAENHVEGMM